MKHVIVIGAGLGGLASGTRLLQCGHRVTILEKEPRVGGYAIAYKRGSYVFDLALHVIPSGGKNQEFSSLLKLLGIDNEVEFIRLKSGFEVFLDDFHFQMPNDLDELIAELSHTFPSEVNGLKKFQYDVEKHVSVYGPVFAYGQSKFKSIPPFLPKIPAFLNHSKLSTKDYFDQFFTNEHLQAILFQPAAFMGINMADFPTVNFMMMFYLLLKDGMFTIKGGGQRLTHALKDQFIKLGGELKLNSEVKKIVCTNNKATGVIISTDSQLDCDAVITGNNLPDVVNKLIGRAQFSTKYLNNLETLRPSVSVLALNVGLDCPPVDLGIENHIAMIFPGPDIDNCFTEQQNEITPLGFSITAAENSDPDHAATAGHTISIIGGTSPQMWMHMNQQEYKENKEKVTGEIISKVTGYFPQLAEHIVIVDLATPRTMARYTANPMGAIMGFNCTAGIHRQLIESSRLPINNVSIGSAWTNRLGGFLQSLKSGVIAAEKI